MAGDEEFGARPTVTVDGKVLQGDLETLMEEVVVDDHLHLPDMFVIRLRNEAKDVLTRIGVRIGSKVTIAANRLGDSALEPLIVAEVTALEAEFDASGSHAVVRGYDLSHRLCRGRRTETYRDTTDGDIARRIAGLVNIPVGQIDSTPTRHEHVSQVNLTDWDFLKARAQEIGYEVAVVLGKFEMRKPEKASGAPSSGDLQTNNRMQLTLGKNLEWFRPRLTAGAQVKDVKVRGWDPRAKKTVKSTAACQTTSAEVAMKPQQLAKLFGDTTYTAGRLPLATQAEADAAAAALSEQIGSAHAEADGVAKGDPLLKAGTPVAIGQAGWPFDGKYTLSSTRHVYAKSGYKTFFQVSGRQERSLLGLASLGATKGAHSAGGPPIYGVVVALVTDVNDPENAGRVKVSFPWLSDTYESWWARLTQMGAGRQRGAVFLPEVNDEVLVAFENGDIRRPYVIGSLYNGVDTPRLGDGLIDRSSGAVKRRGLVSKKGHRLVFLDDDAKSGIALVSGNDGYRISINQSGTTIKVSSKGTVEIEGVGEIKVKSDASITVDAGTTMTLKATAGITIDGGVSVDVKGALVRLN